MSNDPLFTLARSLLFRMPPERAHERALSALARPALQPWLSHRYARDGRAVDLLGLHFANPVGLAAGLDKNGDCIDGLGALGFGFIEIGTVTPKAQSGNPQPRLFRLVPEEALINRMGFNNLGVDHLCRQVEKRTWQGVLGINIGKNARTPLEKAADDYLACLEKVYPLADYVTVNISSPNTKNLRDLQHGKPLRKLLDTLKNAQSQLATRHARHCPLLIKIAPDMRDAELDDFCAAVAEYAIEGVICGNTTRERGMVAASPLAREEGGLSGAPLRALADERLAAVAARLTGNTVLVGVGGITQGRHAADKLSAGAQLVQVYSGLIFRGPALVRDCIEETR